MTAPTTPRLDPDSLALLEEERDFLLRSLDDLEREHAAGDVDDHDYATLKDDYTARAAGVIRAIEAHEAQLAAARPPRSPGRLLAVAAAVVLFAVLAGVLVAQAAGRRDSGDELTGGIREPSRTQVGEAPQAPAGGQTDPELARAVAAASEGRYGEAVRLIDELLAEQPDNAEAMAYKGWFQYRSGDGDGVVTLIDAARTDPETPEPHAFLAVVFCDLGRPDTARLELDRLEQLDPPPEITGLTDGLRQRVEAGQC